jgi:pyruvate dehydrogenase E2 component (dihydrolipoamide acetyltransferase)
MDNRHMEVVMPKVGLTMTEGAIVEWHKREGDVVRKGELLFTFETEKSTLEYESPDSGVLARILVPVGQTVACFTPVGVLGDAAPNDEGGGRKAASTAPAGHAAPSTMTPSRPLPAPTDERRPVSPRARMRARELNVDLASVTATGPDGAIRERDVLNNSPKTENSKLRIENSQLRIAAATPVAQRLAAELGVDLSAVDGSGPDGKITRADVERAASSRPAASPAAASPVAAASPSPLTPARRVTAQRMTANAQAAPHVTLTTEIDATELVNARNQLNAELQDKISYNALLVAMCARALREQPELNASWADASDGRAAGIIMRESIDIGVAVDTPRGLFVPVLRDCGAMPLARIHAALADLVDRTLAGQARPDELSGGTFTITNLGMFEIDAFTPIINLPEAAILGVGRIVKKPAAVGDQIALRQMMTLSLSFDHRVVDGAPAAKFLQRVKHLIERPFALLLL